MSAEYLKKSVGKYLCKALCEVAIRRPERPIEFLAYYLIDLYEKDLKMQRTEKEVDLNEELKSVTNLTAIPEFSELFMRKLSSSMSRNLEDISPAVASPSISIGLDEALTEEGGSLPDKENLLAELGTNEEAAEERSISGEEDETSPEKEVESAVDDVVQKVSKLVLTDLYDIPERKLSAIRDNEPVTEIEAREFGTKDPFLARRNTNLFDVNFAPIGDPSNQPKPPQ